MRLKQYLTEAKSPKQIKKEWKKWSIKRQNLLGRKGKSKEYEKARKKELELAHEYWKLTGFEFEGLGQMPFEKKITESNNDEFSLLNGIRIAFNIRKGNEFFLSVNKFPNVSDKQLNKAKEILMSTREIKKLVKMSKSISQEEAMDVSMEKAKKREKKDAIYYSLLSSPMHYEMLKKLR